jgi:hypothetical protein
MNTPFPRTGADFRETFRSRPRLKAVRATSSSALPLRRALNGLAGMLLVAALAGCGGEHGHRPPFGPFGGGPGGPPIPKMEGHDVLFDGQIEAEVLLAPAGTRWAHGDETDGAGPGEGGGRRGHGFRMGAGAGGGGFRTGTGFGGDDGRPGRGGEGGGGPPPGGMMGGGPPPGMMEGGPPTGAPSMQMANGPEIQLRLRLTNHGAAPAIVEVLDFDSDLGNFVVRPAKIALPPGEPVEADPMISRLGVSRDQVPVTLRIRIDGRSDRKVITLAPVQKPPATPGSGEPPPGS